MKNSRKVKVELEKRLKRSQEVFKDKSFFNALAEETAEQIRTRTRLRKSAEKNGQSKPLKKLSEGYIKQRSKYRKNLSDQTNPRRSNLTATGQMLDSIFGKYKASSRSIIIDIKDRRTKTLSGRGVSKIGNKKLIEYNEDMGRRFFDLTKAQLNDLRSKIREKIRDLLAKN